LSEPIVRVDSALCRLNAGHTLRIDEFTVSCGEHWCVFGGNGAGKSVLASLLLGDLKLGHRHVHHAAGLDLRRDVAVVSFEEQQRLWQHDSRVDMSEYHEDAADPGTTVLDLVSAVRPEPDDTLDTLIDTLGLTQLTDKGIRFLSSGQVRRALIARAIWQNPRLLILDDPLESIDRDSRDAIAAVIQQRMRDDNATLLLTRCRRNILPGITHMALMQDLQISEQGTLKNVMDSHAFRTYVSRRPSVSDTLPGSDGRRAPKCADPGTAMIALENVSASYHGRPVFTGLNWSMWPGQHTLVEGPNGCGKSTLLGLIDGDNHKAYGQRVMLFGRQRGSGETVWDVKAYFGVVSNELHNRYVKGWRVRDVVVSGFFDSVGLYDDSGASELNCALAWLEAVGLRSEESAYYHELSFGQQRLVLLARAMVKQPVVLVLDEPCVGLDDHYRELILALVDRIATGGQTHILYVSHTEGESPSCINQYLRFSGTAETGYVIEVS